MVITVTCPSCAASFPVDSKKIPAAGVSARCSSCRYVFRIERPVEPPPAPPEPVWAPPPPVHAPPPRAPEPEPAPESTWAPPPPPPPPAPESEPAWAPPPPEPEPYVEPEPAPDFGITSFEEPAAHEEPAHAETDFSVGATAQERAPAEREWVFEKEEQIDPGSLNIQPLEAAEPAPFAPAPFQAAPPLPPAPEPPAPAHAEPAVGSFTFGKRDPKDKARRLARVLVSDMIMYNPQRHERALANGSLREDFEDEIAKSWKEYVDQVGEEMATQNPFWADALNDVLAKGQKIF